MIWAAAFGVLLGAVLALGALRLRSRVRGRDGRAASPGAPGEAAVGARAGGETPAVHFEALRRELARLLVEAGAFSEWFTDHARRNRARALTLDEIRAFLDALPSRASAYDDVLARLTTTTRAWADLGFSLAHVGEGEAVAGIQRAASQRRDWDLLRRGLVEDGFLPAPGAPDASLRRVVADYDALMAECRAVATRVSADLDALATEAAGAEPARRGDDPRAREELARRWRVAALGSAEVLRLHRRALERLARAPTLPTPADVPELRVLGARQREVERLVTQALGDGTGPAPRALGSGDR